MHLSRLEIFGFKSFANKLDLRMDDGITAVVGPNGCGKPILWMRSDGCWESSAPASSEEIVWRT